MTLTGPTIPLAEASAKWRSMLRGRQLSEPGSASFETRFLRSAPQDEVLYFKGIPRPEGGPKGRLEGR